MHSTHKLIVIYFKVFNTSLHLYYNKIHFHDPIIYNIEFSFNARIRG